MKLLKTLVVVFILLVSVNVFAASSIVLAPPVYESQDKGQVVIALTCTAHTDGTFDNKALTEAIVGLPYFIRGYYIGHVWAVNSATDDHTSGAVTITDATTQQLVGATAGDTLTLSTAASGVAYLSSARSASQRPVTSQLTIAVSDTGSTAVVFTLYILLVR